MDLFEEIVRMRRAGLRAALATIVHTNGSIPSYESSRMLVREDGSIAGTVGRGQGGPAHRSAAQAHLQPEPRSRKRQRPDLRRHPGGVRGAHPAAAHAV